MGWLVAVLILLLFGLAGAGWIVYLILKTELEFLTKRVESLERTTDELVNEER